ncbi:hypothetical protein LFM09_32980 [Lentzea alba]|uniref:hypothetical protein n=1 Tax=Lentzea alba TaxID=2714351 RepID=UPI0039BF5620
MTPLVHLDGSSCARPPPASDEGRVEQFDEAWLPVLTPDGPGVLWCCDSDRPRCSRRDGPGVLWCCDSDRPRCSRRDGPGVLWWRRSD